MYYVYVLKNKVTKEPYYGYTCNLEKRMAEHKRYRWGMELVYYEAYESEIDARNRERNLKHYAQALTALKIRLTESLK